MYHQNKKCKNCVLNGDCLHDNPDDCEDVDEAEDENEEIGISYNDHLEEIKRD